MGMTCTTHKLQHIPMGQYYWNDLRRELHKDPFYALLLSNWNVVSNKKIFEGFP